MQKLIQSNIICKLKHEKAYMGFTVLIKVISFGGGGTL